MPVAAALLLALAAAGAIALRRQAPAPPPYTTVAASRGTVAPAVIASGTVNPVSTIQVGTYISGVIRTVLCDFNSRVRAGQLCARIDSRPYQTAVERDAAAVGSARAQLRKDQANLDYARLADQRSRALLARGFVPQAAVDASANAYRLAQAQLEVDRAALAEHVAQWQASLINLSYTEIVSPVDGIVVARNVSQGQTVAASFQTPTLFLIASDLTRMQVDANVSESDIGRIAVGNPVSFTVAAYPERQFAGRVVQVRQAPQTVQSVVTYDVVVDVPNADLALKPGMTAAARIVTHRAQDVLRVPSQALRYRPAAHAGPAAAAQRATQVWVLDGARARPVPLSVGLDDESFAEVTGGALREGDAVIVTESAAAPDRRKSGLLPVRR
jgi:HlyD family secretion protein